MEKYTAKGVQKLIDDGTINAVAGRGMAAESAEAQGDPSVDTPEDHEIRMTEPMIELDNVIAKLEQISALLKKAI